MEITYKWKITGLKKRNDPSAELNDIIVQTYWECTGTDENGNTGTFPGATPFDPDQIDPENFTSYEDLTEEQVIGWIQDFVENNSGYKTHIESLIEKQIDENVRLVVEVNSDAFPWIEPSSNTAPEVTENIYTGPEATANT